MKRAEELSKEEVLSLLRDALLAYRKTLALALVNNEVNYKLAYGFCRYFGFKLAVEGFVDIYLGKYKPKRKYLVANLNDELNPYWFEIGTKRGLQQRIELLQKAIEFYKECSYLRFKLIQMRSWIFSEK